MRTIFLILLTMSQAIIFFLCLYGIGMHWASASIISGGLLGLGLEVRLRGK